jgi:hypothetical protein
MTTIIDGGAASSAPISVLDGGTATVLGSLTFPGPPQLPATEPRTDPRTLSLESLDGSMVIPLGQDVEHLLLGGATGLMLPPIDVVTSTTPGMVGSWLQQVVTLEREVFLPIKFVSEVSYAAFIADLGRLIDLVSGWDDITIGQLGTFRLVASSPEQEDRVLTVTYKSGWEGVWGVAGGGGSSTGTLAGPTWEQIGLTLIAVDPYWRARDPEVLTFRTPAENPVFLGTGDNTHPWPRQISASEVIGNAMPIMVGGDVPVWATVTVDGFVSQATISWPGTSVTVPAGVPDGSSLVLNTDLRNRSARMNGAIAWSSLTMGSTFAPLVPGINSVDVNVGTSGPNTGLTLSWTPGWRSAFG